MSIERLTGELNGVNAGGGVMYLSDDYGQGWRKVTEHHGSPHFQHANLEIEPGSFEEAPDE